MLGEKIGVFTPSSVTEKQSHLGQRHEEARSLCVVDHEHGFRFQKRKTWWRKQRKMTCHPMVIEAFSGKPSLCILFSQTLLS
jgi:hypothetical protein